MKISLKIKFFFNVEKVTENASIEKEKIPETPGKTIGGLPTVKPGLRKSSILQLGITK